MSAVMDILDRVKRLSPAEKAEVREQLPAVVGRRVVKTPNVCFGRARVDGTRIPLWSVEMRRQDGMPDAAILEDLPSLTPADLESISTYTAANRAEVDADIAYQRADWDDEDAIPMQPLTADAWISKPPTAAG